MFYAWLVHLWTIAICNLSVNHSSNVLLKSQFITRSRSRSITYELDLPSQLSRVHPVFHIEKLKPYKNRDQQFTERKYNDRPLPELLDNGEEAWEVRQIVDKRVRRGRTEYLVLWKGYPDHEKTWEPISSLKYAREAVREYEQSVQQ